MKVLVVDDFSTMRRIIKNILKKIGYDDVIQASDGQEAKKVLNQLDVDMVLTDWNMPNMNGIELLRYIRSTENLCHIPVLMITAEQKREQIIAAAHAGVNGYIIKPFNENELKEKIDKIKSRLGE